MIPFESGALPEPVPGRGAPRTGAADERVLDAEQLAPTLGVDAEAVRAHLAQVPDRYLFEVPARAVVRHAALCATRIGPAEVRTRVAPGVARDDGTCIATGDDGGPASGELDVVSRVNPQVFVRVAGVIALHGGSTVAAHAFNRRDGVSVGTFTVCRPAGTSSSWWARVEGDLAEAVAGRLALRARLRRHGRGSAGLAARAPATSVQVERDSAADASVVEVHTRDRVGALYWIASALAELELEVVSARIQTRGTEVVDVFVVRDAAGSSLDADHVAELELAVVAALDEG